MHNTIEKDGGEDTWNHGAWEKWKNKEKEEKTRKRGDEWESQGEFARVCMYVYM